MKKKLAIILSCLLAVSMLAMTACGKANTPGANLSQDETNVPGDGTEAEPSKPYEDAYYSITISINPVVKLLMNKNDEVLEVQCLNADSEVAYGKIMDDLIGKPVTQATEAIVQSAIEQGYLKEGASCTISCEDVWEASDALVEQFTQIQQTVQTVLVNENREDAAVVMEMSDAVQILETSGVQVNEEFKEKYAQVTPAPEGDPVKSNYHDDDLWPNLLFIMKPGEIVEEVIFLNDSSNRAYAGVTQNVVGMKDVEAAKVYLAAAYSNGYLWDQLDYTGGADIPAWVHDKLIVFKNYEEAISSGLIPIPHEFWSKCPRVALIVDDSEKVTEVLYLNASASSELSGINYVGQNAMSASGSIVQECFNRGYIRFTNIPIEMFEHIITVYNEEEAQQMGLK